MYLQLKVVWLGAPLKRVFVLETLFNGAHLHLWANQGSKLQAIKSETRFLQDFDNGKIIAVFFGNGLIPNWDDGSFFDFVFCFG